MSRPIAALARPLFCLVVMIVLSGCTRTDHVYLTWQHDPSTTMTVNFHSLTHYPDLKLHYDTDAHEGVVAEYASSATGTTRQIPGLRDNRYIYHLEATGLTPGEVYHFVLASDGKRLTREMRFRPLPEGDAPVHFISGGDMTMLPRAHQLTRLAAERDPMFGLIGGDIAYANGNLRNAWMWDRWLSMWEQNMVTSDGVLVPLVLAIGNHESNDSTGSLAERSPFYYGFFPQGGQSYFTRRLRNDTLLIVLDSGHSVPVDGAQAEWLETTLRENQEIRNLVAVYHAPLYPSYRDSEDFRAVAGRKYWLPLFDLYGLDVAFENHDHAFKRSKVLKNNAVSETGTVYLGDGCFGVNPRTVSGPERWYLEKSSGTPHFWDVRIDESGMHFEAISHARDILDDLTLSAP